MRWIVFLLVFSLTIGRAAGQQPSRAMLQPTIPVPLNAREEQKAQAVPPQRGSAKDNAGTENAPFFVKMAPSPDAYPETDQQRKERVEKASQDWWTEIFVAITAVATALLVFVTAGLWRATYRLYQTTADAVRDSKSATKAAFDAVDAANRHADVSDKLVRVTEATAKRQLRAYLFIDDAFIRWAEVDERMEHPSGIVVFYTIKNNGYTPANKVGVQHSARIISVFSENNAISGEADYLGTIAPRGDVVDDIQPTVRGRATAEELAQKEKIVVLRGTITYIDVFDDTRTTDFHFCHQGRIESPHSRMFAECDGNDAT